VRQAYKGPLTYAANWDEEYIKVKFWNMLDYIGIDAYFPLSDEARPTFEQLMAGWNEWVKEMETLQAAVDKPVIFPEIGYCSVKYAAKAPFEEPARGEVDLELQADCYRAVYETFWGKDWFYGMYWWKWGTDTRLGGANNRGYYIQNKPAEKVVTTWYTTKPVSQKKY